MLDIKPHIDRFLKPPFRHQLTGSQRIVDDEFLGLFDDCGLGKTKQVIDALCVLNVETELRHALIVAPASVRIVWADPDPTFGEIAKHSWMPARVMEYHSKGFRELWSSKDFEPEDMTWIVTNYEYLRKAEKRERLLTVLDERPFMMVLDEASFIKNHKAQQTKACLALGQHAARRVILNGTPVTNGVLDLWPQMKFLSPKILPFRNFYAFRAAYAVMGGWQNRQVVGYQRLDELQARVAPYVLRREKADCLDLPAKTYTQVEVELTEATWKKYKEMRDEAITWLDQNPSMASQAGVKVMRLAQITSGLLGGLIDPDDDNEAAMTDVIGSEKLDWLSHWVVDRLTEDPKFRVIVWCRFRPEIDRVVKELSKILPSYRLHGLGKTLSRADRVDNIERFTKSTDRPGLLAAQQRAGGFGLNLVAASTSVYLSNDRSLLTRLQSEDRVHRPGQLNNVLYIDVIATGPRGQRTIDTTVVKALREKDDLAKWTVSAWKEALKGE